MESILNPKEFHPLLTGGFNGIILPDKKPFCFAKSLGKTKIAVAILSLFASQNLRNAEAFHRKAFWLFLLRTLQGTRLTVSEPIWFRKALGKAATAGWSEQECHFASLNGMASQSLFSHEKSLGKFAPVGAKPFLGGKEWRAFRNI